MTWVTFVLRPEDEDARMRHHFKLVVFGGAGHLDGSQWDHAFRVGVLERQVSLRHLQDTGHEDEAPPHLLAAKVHQVLAVKLDVTFLEDVVPENEKKEDVNVQRTTGRQASKIC